jgi:hypothetical protein
MIHFTLQKGVASLFLHAVRGSALGIDSMTRPGFPDHLRLRFGPNVIKLQEPTADLISAKKKKKEENPEDCSSSFQNARVFCD